MNTSTEFKVSQQNAEMRKNENHNNLLPADHGKVLHDDEIRLSRAVAAVADTHQTRLRHLERKQKLKNDRQTDIQILIGWRPGYPILSTTLSTGYARIRRGSGFLTVVSWT